MTAGFGLASTVPAQQGGGTDGPPDDQELSAPTRPGPYPPAYPRATGSGTPDQAGPPPYQPPGMTGPPAPARGGWPPPAVPPPAVPPPVSPPARRRPVLAALVVLLLAAAAGEGIMLHRDGQRLDRVTRQAAADRAAADRRIAGLDIRIRALEAQAAASLDSTAVASAVLPSVFRVDAGQFTGTAFALGRAPAGGGTNLITNYHVIQASYEKGTRTAALERENQRFPVTITRVDPKNDLALLHSDQTFNRLNPGGDQVSPGAPIVVVGAPLGLSQSVTTGVVSAVRDDFPGEAGKTFIQISAPINPGNSGGPVVNAQKQVVGIASAKANNAEGIGLAIPIRVACGSFTTLC